MRNSLSEIFIAFEQDESGQGITEYGAILAFVAVLVVVVAAFVNGNLRSALSQSYSSVTSALNSLNGQAT